jgi:hypothetical protein
MVKRQRCLPATNGALAMFAPGTTFGITLRGIGIDASANAASVQYEIIHVTTRQNVSLNFKVAMGDSLDQMEAEARKQLRQFAAEFHAAASMENLPIQRTIRQ